MRITVFLLLFSVIQVMGGRSYSQNTRLSLNLKDVSIEDVLDEIENQSEFFFLFNQKLLNVDRKVDINVKNERIKDILANLFTDEDINCLVIDRQILLSPKYITETVNATRDRQPQEIVVTGKVTDEDGTPLPGVNIVIKGTITGTITDVDGNYSIEVEDTDATLVFSFIGYKSQEILVSNQTTINVILEVEAYGLDEVVAIGYGVKMKKDLTGSMSSIGAKQLVEVPAQDIGTALVGKISGVSVTKMGGGNPRINQMISIRGNNSINTPGDPLFVVNGIIMEADIALSNLNVNDIESIDVLKDASSTAIYGSRGANGVILISTKKGKEGKTLVEFGHFTTFGMLARHEYQCNAEQLLYVYEQAMANGPKYGDVIGSMDYRGGYATDKSYSELGYLFKQVEPHSYIVDLVGNDGNYYAPRWDTDWEEEMYGKTAISNSEYLSIRGGNENATFNISVNAARKNGLMRKSYMNRYSARIRSNIKVLDWLRVAPEVEIQKSRNSNRDGGSWQRWGLEAWSILPPKTYPDDPSIYGSFAGRWSCDRDFHSIYTWGNTNHRMEKEHGYDNNERIQGSISLTANINKYLTYISNVAGIVGNPKSYSANDGLFGGINSASITNSYKYIWQNENYLQYKRNFDDLHDIDALVGLSWFKDHGESSRLYNTHFLSDFYKWNNMTAGESERPSVSSSEYTSTLNSFFGRVNYTFDNKYLLTFTGRYDGSSKFGSKYKYGFFPSMAFAWRVDNEDFIKNNIDAISNFKLRLSWGQTGNERIGAYESQQYLSATQVVLGSSVYTGLYPSSVGNNKLKWETTTQTNIGCELGLWKNVVNLTVDYYYKKTTDMLLDVLTPNSTTVGSLRKNFGSMENKGWDINLRTYNFRKGDFKWNTIVNFYRNQNKILKLGPTGADIYRHATPGRATSVLREGESIGSFYGLIRDGTYNTTEASLAAKYGMKPGDVKFRDTNGDGQIDLYTDGVIIGNAFPEWRSNLSNTFTYKNFDATINIQISYGAEKVSTNESAEDRIMVSGQHNTVVDAWRPDHQNTEIAQLRPGLGGCYYQSFPDNHMISDASFIKGQGATIGYTFPKSLTSKIGIQNARIYVSAERFFLLTRVEGYNAIGTSDTWSGMDPLKPRMSKYAYPNPMEFSIGINVTL